MSTAVKKSDQFPKMLDQFKGEIARALPSHLNGDRMCRIALTAFRRTPKLGDCDPRSVFAAVIQASQLGLEPDTLGRSYLIPYGKECQFVPGWKGLVQLANNTKQCTVWTGAVKDGDGFSYQLGDSPFVRHVPGDNSDESELTHVYAIGRVKDAQWPVIEVWPMSRVWAHRDRYNKVGKKHYSYENPEMYARKVVLLQVLKYMPASPELALAIGLNDAAEIGKQHLTVDDAIDGTWTPAPDEDNAPGSQPLAEPQSRSGTGTGSTQKPPMQTAESVRLITEKQSKMIYARLMDAKVELPEFCQAYSIQRIDELAAENLDDALQWIQFAQEQGRAP